MEYGGAQKLLLAQAYWFWEHGHKVTVAFFYDKHGLASVWRKNQPFRVIDLGGWNPSRWSILNIWKLLRGLIHLFRLLRHTQAIETFTTHSNLLGITTAWLAGVPVRIATLHGYLRGPFGLLPLVHGRLMNSFLSTKLVVVSKQVYKSALATERINSSKICIIPNGIDVHEYKSIGPEKRDALRRKLAVPPMALVALVIGRLVPVKGHTILLHAVATMPPLRRTIKYLLVGTGELLGALEADVSELGIGDQVRFLGTRDDVKELLQAADLFIHPSLQEGLPVALLEAMATGLPIIASRVGAAEDLIENKKSGLLVPPGDTCALANSIEVLVSNKRMRRTLGAAARKRAVELYSLDRMCLAYQELMMDLLEKK